MGTFDQIPIFDHTQKCSRVLDPRVKSVGQRQKGGRKDAKQRTGTAHAHLCSSFILIKTSVIWSQSLMNSYTRCSCVNFSKLTSLNFNFFMK